MSSESLDRKENDCRDAKVDLDTILVEEIGQFGKFQLRTLALTLVAVIFCAVYGEFVFTAARINSRCLIPECEEPSTAVYAPDWILNAIPGTSLTSFDNCQRFANASTILTDRSTCPADLFDVHRVVQCEAYVYEHAQTVVYDFDLGCDEWRRTLIGFVRTFGSLVALPITGYISDHWGRRFALTFNAFNSGWIGVTRYWANTYSGYIVSVFVESALGGAVFSCTYILVLELVGPKYRTVAGAILTTFFAVGQVILALVAWAVPYWRPLTLAMYIPQLITIGYLWVISESIRWYMSKNNYDEAEKLLQNVAKVNGKQLSRQSLEALRRTAEEQKRRIDIEKKDKIKEPWLIVLVFQNRRILIRCLVSPIWWITSTLIYHGLSINAVNMSGNAYLNYAAVAAAGIPGFWLAVLLMSRIGRRPVLIGAYWLCGLCQVAYIFMPDDLYAVSLAVYLVGKISISTVVTAIYMYTAELYPTKYRHNLFAFSSMVGRIGSIIAPLTPAIGAATFDNLPFILFASMAFLSGFLMFLTPETNGTKLPDTMEEASNIGLRDK